MKKHKKNTKKSAQNKAYYAKTKAKEQGDIDNVIFDGRRLDTSVKTSGMSTSMHALINSPKSPLDINASPAMTRIATKSHDNVEQVIKKRICIN